MINKYVIVKGHPVLFSNELIHAEVVRNIEGLDGAGFFIIRKDHQVSKLNVVCLGESTSLCIKSRPEIDQVIIADFLNLEQHKTGISEMEPCGFKCTKCERSLVSKEFHFVFFNYVLKFLALNIYWCIACKANKWDWNK
ncbi:hypothetical protein [Pedobacter gandavensis]|uniref:hypothetical protein n=1 Tax=Pedobacter gandavensis TaxID=2679963 RepID=UPI00292E1D76|nr:hypothetical protein [Pedobacter gandavensis]